MLSTLIESRPVRTRRPGAAAVSVVTHLTLLIAAVVATARAGGGHVVAPKPEAIHLLAPTPPAPTAKAATATTSTNSSSTPTAPTILLIPTIEIPNGIPTIDLTRSMPDNLAIVGTTGPGLASTGIVTLGGGVSDSLISNVFADKHAYAIPNQKPPTYPALLLQSRMEGVVEARFIIDSAGRAEMESFAVLSSPHELFTKAVREALPRMRYIPAEVNRRKVRVIVQQAFTFVLAR